jgi:hypothetical protein
MILEFDKERDFILLHLNNEMLGMELEDLFSYNSMGCASITVDEPTQENLIFSCEFDEGNRRCYEIFCRRIQKNLDLEDRFTISNFEIMEIVHSFICEKKSIGGYLSSAVVNNDDYYFTLSYSDHVFDIIKDLSGSELSRIKKNLGGKVFYSIYDLNDDLELCEGNWKLVKKIKNNKKIEECSNDFFISKIKDHLYNFYKIPSRISLIMDERGLVCEFFEGNRSTSRLSFYDSDFDILVKNAFFEPSAILEYFRFDFDKNRWLICYTSHF